MILDKLLPTNVLSSIMASFPCDACRLICQIYYNYGCTEYAYKFYTKDDFLIERRLNDPGEFELNNSMTSDVRQFIDENTIYNVDDSDYWNICIIEVLLNGEYTIHYSFANEIDLIDDKYIRQTKAYELYKERKSQGIVQFNNKTINLKKSRSKANDDIGEKNDFKNKSTSEHSIPELLGFIVMEYRNDIPDGWLSIRLDAKIQYINNQTHVSTINFYSTIDVESQRFTPSNSIGTMNAVVKINEIMRSQNQNWFQATFYFKPDGSAQIQVKEGMNS